MRILFPLLLILFSASIVYGQEKKIKKAIEAPNENNYTEYISLIEASNITLESKIDWEIPTTDDYKKLNAVLEIIEDFRSRYWTSSECDSTGAFN
jgi:hypothetical protein